jgi:hypothetical protein
LPQCKGFRKAVFISPATSQYHLWFIKPGETATFRLGGQGAQLSNKGGTITLLNSDGLKVDGVAYTKEQAKSEGSPVVFM